MQEVNVFEYAVIRVVPRVEREEFINVGVILFCKRKKYLDVQYLIDDKKLLSLHTELDLEIVSQHLKAYKNIALGENNTGKIGQLEESERFRWLTATRSTLIQSSKVHSGLSYDLPKTLERVFKEQVL